MFGSKKRAEEKRIMQEKEVSKHAAFRETELGEAIAAALLKHHPGLLKMWGLNVLVNENTFNRNVYLLGHQSHQYIPLRWEIVREIAKQEAQKS